eukprot:1051912-Pyramimonas_sp.AAC.1
MSSAIRLRNGRRSGAPAWLFRVRVGRWQGGQPVMQDVVAWWRCWEGEAGCDLPRRAALIAGDWPWTSARSL